MQRFCFTKYNGITLGFKQKNYNEMFYVKNSDEKYQYIVEVNKEMIYDYTVEKERNFWLDIIKKAIALGNGQMYIQL